MSGKQTSTQSVPAFVTEGGEFGVDRGMQLAEMGYMPYHGPDVAALSPMQYASMQNTNRMAEAFGMSNAGTGGTPGEGQLDPMTGLPAAQNFGGAMGYSAAPIYQGAMSELERLYPGQFQAYMDMFIDPQTGQMRGAEQEQDGGLLASDLWSRNRQYGGGGGGGGRG